MTPKTPDEWREFATALRQYADASGETPVIAATARGFAYGIEELVRTREQLTATQG